VAVHLTESNGGKTLEVAVSGKLSHSDYEHFVPRFEHLVRQHGTIRVLFEMTDFHGWEAAALWDDVKLDLKHFAAVERLAMVGDQSCEKAMSVGPPASRTGCHRGGVPGHRRRTTPCQGDRRRLRRS